MIRYALPLIALATAACEPKPAPESTPAPAPGLEAACKSEGLEDLVGQPRSEAVAAEAKRRSGAAIVRFLTPDMMVTQEYRGDRLNIHLGSDGKIGSLRCG